MVFPIAFLLLAHGADPTPLGWDEALANLVKFLVALALVALSAYPILMPLLGERNDPPTMRDDGTGTSNNTKNEVLGWIAVAMMLVLAVSWWLFRTSLVEVMTEDSKAKEEHAHTQLAGGQVAMWGDFHAEIVRIESGEVRVYLRDSYNRDIDARFFEAEIEALTSDSEKVGDKVVLSTKSALNDAFRFARLPRDRSSYRVTVSTPGWSTSLKFDFDGGQGRRSLPIWCAPPQSYE